jgi:Tol biopolymer transport system component
MRPLARRSLMYKRLALPAICAVLVALALPSAGAATAPGPNGLIAFRADVGSGYQIYLIEPDGTHQRQLTQLPGDALQPHWTPESNRIVFEFDPANPIENDFCHVAYMNRNGGGLKILPLTNGDQCEGAPTFSADGHRIFYEGFDGVSRDAIFSMDLNGKDRRLVTDCQGHGVTDPEVSPDGTMLSFTCYADEGGALFAARVDGSDLRQLTPFSFQVGNKSDWSPDSQRIMFITEMNDVVNTATIRPDGTDLFWVTSYPGGGATSAYGNSYSPDGNWILLRLEQDELYALFKIHPDGTGLTQITPFSTFRPRGMGWGSALGPH